MALMQVISMYTAVLSEKTAHQNAAGAAVWKVRRTRALIIPTVLQWNKLVRYDVRKKEPQT